MNPALRYPVARPSLTELEEAYVLDALRSGWISSQGPYLRRFEAEFAARCGTPTAVATGNGTLALHLVLAAAGIGPGDEVIVPALTYVATANAVTYCGARPVFVDVDPATWCVDVDRVGAAVTARTRAVVAVDLYGHPADYPRLREICAGRDILLVADAAESFGARLGGTGTGGLADASTFSFFGNKILTSGEGGCVTTFDPALAERMRLLRNQGMDPQRRYYFPVVGYNYRLTNLAAALLCAQLERGTAMVQRRQQIVATYEKAFADLGALTPQPVAVGVERAPWMASFLVGPAGDGRLRDRLAVELDRLGVETRPFFVPIPELPPYRAAARDDGFPVTTDLSRRGINLPTYADLTDPEVLDIADRVRTALARLSAAAPA
ncbi:DegT/DnrJ/EryC1/StrS family aminotransferase [Plantactinospora endophytica]|uniref:GDP-perosamine synthase n=1 Tax=Plantactinospora endophytica TaxID=673535 RepID=A0ABQ4EAJ6_9ACTN|nr:DegT/DnrJ/EryC1/StrS family aminotransferase [Plantactinospora endophytica]GIG91686.1 GDP-perosamine synthase [Plantactinospora endophytica]